MIHTSEFDFERADETLAAQERRAVGMARARRGARKVDPAWEEAALAALREFARTRLHFAVEDVRAACGTPAGASAKCWGPLVKRAHRLGIVQPDGFCIVNCSNRSPRVRWRSLVYEPGVNADASRG